MFWLVKVFWLGQDGVVCRRLLSGFYLAQRTHHEVTLFHERMGQGEALLSTGSVDESVEAKVVVGKEVYIDGAIVIVTIRALLCAPHLTLYGLCLA